MRKTIRIVAFLVAVLLMIGCLAGCNSEEQKKEMEQAVHEQLAGSWVFFDEKMNTRYTYILNFGMIEQHAVLTDDQGIDHDLSLGDYFGIRYRVKSANEIEIYSTMTGEDGALDPIKFEKVDDNTLILDGVTYIRFEEWIKTHPISENIQ